MLFLQDGFYATTDFSSYSVVPLKGFTRWSDLMKTKFNGFYLDKSQLLM